MSGCSPFLAQQAVQATSTMSATHDHTGAEGLNPAIVAEFPYEFDTFQVEACVSLEKGHHVLCLAHTSAGKSTIALYAIAKVLLEGKRLIYTAPVKSLSNQKYAELKRKYGNEAVGLATGDNKINLDADILVMTTEILRNMLSKPTWSTVAIRDQSVAPDPEKEGQATVGDERLACVVFDEAHYINDRSRGNVYEECIMKLPSQVQMIFLSATMANPQHFQNWVQKIKPDRPVAVSSTLKRPVPLCFHIFVPKPETFEETMPWETAVEEGHLAVILNGEHGTFLSDVYTSMCKRYHEVVNYKLVKPKEEREKIGINGSPASAKPAPPVPPTVEPATAALKRVKRTVPWQMIGMLNKFINFLSINNQLPAIFFTLSRKKCNALANHVESTLCSPGERREIENIFDFHIRALADASQYRQVNELRALLLKGIGVHHSGMLTLLKEIVEMIFTKGLIKIMFATETLAIGVNTPTRVTCFTDVMKYDGYTNYKRALTVEEFKQMAGRAGRRGLDKVGNVIYFPVEDPLLLPEIQSMLSGPLRVLSSNFAVTTQYVLRLLRSLPASTEADLFRATRKSLLSIEMQMAFADKEKQIAQLLTTVDGYRQSQQDIARRYPILAELSELQKSLVVDKLGQGAVKKLKQKIQSKLAELSKQEQAEQTKYAELSRQEGLAMESLERLQSDLLGVPDAGIKEQLAFTVGFLIQSGFVFTAESGTLHLTQDGLFASCITQCHEIILTRAIMLGFANDFRHDPALLSAWLSLFIGTEGDEQKGRDRSAAGPQVPDSFPPSLKDACQSTMDMAAALFSEMHRSYSVLSDCDGTAAPEQLFTTFLEPMHLWAQRSEHFEAICLNHGFFEGNFVRALQKMVNLFNELLLAFEITNQPEWVNCIQTCKEAFVHGILLIESIYI
jgi:superfamily II RNA helicase